MVYDGVKRGGLLRVLNRVEGLEGVALSVGGDGHVELDLCSFLFREANRAFKSGGVVALYLEGDVLESAALNGNDNLTGVDEDRGSVEFTEYRNISRCLTERIEVECAVEPGEKGSRAAIGNTEGVNDLAVLFFLFSKGECAAIAEDMGTDVSAIRIISIKKV